MSTGPPGVPVASAGFGSRKGSTKPYDPNRFYCPFPGCNRSFAELWRLKVHYRAPPDVRGSGKERGHGAELAACPKCGVDLKPGKHHVGCFGGRTAPRQARRRLSKGEEGSRKRGKTVDTPVQTVQPLTAPLQPAPLQWQSVHPDAFTWGMPPAAVVPTRVPAAPFFMDFSQFSHPIPEAAVFTPSVTQNPFTLDEINDQYSTFVFGKAGEAPIMATANLACDVNLCIPGHDGQRNNYQPTPMKAPEVKPDPLRGLDDAQVGLVEIDNGLFDAAEFTADFFNDAGPGSCPLSWSSKEHEVHDAYKLEDYDLMGMNKRGGLDRWRQADFDPTVAPSLMPLRLDHQPPQEVSELTGANDILFTAPGIIEPLALTLNDVKAQHNNGAR